MKWKVDTYSCDLGSEELIITREKHGWYLESEALCDLFKTLADAKKKAESLYGEEDVCFSPTAWSLDVKCVHPAGDEDKLSAFIERMGPGVYMVEVIGPYIEVATGTALVAPSLSQAKKACEHAIKGLLNFLETLGWKVKK